MTYDIVPEKGLREVIYITSPEQEIALGGVAEAKVYRREELPGLMGRACYIHRLVGGSVRNQPKAEQFAVRVQAGTAQSVATGVLNNIARTETDGLDNSYRELLNDQELTYSVAALSYDNEAYTDADRDQYMAMAVAAGKILDLYGRIQTEDSLIARPDNAPAGV